LRAGVASLYISDETMSKLGEKMLNYDKYRVFDKVDLNDILFAFKLGSILTEGRCDITSRDVEMIGERLNEISMRS